jgi:iron complex transport system ATP-binding protein
LSRLIGIVLTEKPDIRSMTVRELVGLGRAPYTGFWGTLTSEDEAIVDDSIRQVGISALSHRFVETLSDGERQKVMIAKALAQQPPVIFLDEPTAFLDFPSKVEVMQLLRRLARDMQKTVFMSTHDLELALQMADRVWLMQRDGLSVGTPQQLADAGTLSRFVERPGIVFDPVALSVRVCKDSSVQ